MWPLARRLLINRGVLARLHMCSLHGPKAATVPARQILPDDVIPRHYRVFLAPDLPKFVYSGKVDIDLDVQRPTRSVSLNILELEIQKVALDGMSPEKTETDADAQSITWTFPKVLQPTGGDANDRVTLSVEFTGILNTGMAGFYRSVHKTKDGEEKIMATTQMEPTDCRRAFPCFDEPALKATFDISIAAEPHLTVISNSDVKSVEDVGGKKITHFNTTPLMSSYLVAFVVGEMNYVESNSFRVPIRVYAEDGNEAKCHYAAELAAQTLKFFEETFGIEYPMPKCDMVGVYSFSSGAMENWGLITYRIVDLFYEEGKSSAKTKTRVTEVVQHELAHQWFGNLVTMEWWDGLWLNEGFATWMSWYAANHFFPDWKVWETYMTDAYSKCMELDGLRNSHPVQVPISRASQVSEIFDIISYLKGSCIIRMLAEYLGEEEFIKGISLYLSRHKYGNTTTDDLWTALSDHSGVDVKAYLDKWTTNTGYPTVVAGEPIGDHKSIEVSQHRYLNTGRPSAEEDAVVFPVWLPVLKADGSVDSSQTLRTRKGTLQVGGENDFFKLNAGQQGIYRVKYTDRALKRLAEEGKKGDESSLSVADRIGIILDLNALSGVEVSATQLLEVAKQWENDKEPNVINALLEALHVVRRRLFFESEELRSSFDKFMASVLTPFIETYGIEAAPGENIRITNTRIEVFRSLVTLGDGKCVSTVLELFRTKKFDIDPNLMPGVFEGVARFGTRQEWQELWQYYVDQKSASGLDALEALGKTLDTDLVAELLGRILTSEIVEQEAFRAVRGAAEGSPAALQVTFDFLVAKWDALRELFSGFGSSMTHIIRDTFGSCTTREQLEILDKLLEGRDLHGVERALSQARDALQGSINALESDVDAVQKWLQ